MSFIRVWKELDMQNIMEHLLIVGDVTGDCSKCRMLGIDYTKARICPQCKTDFKYVTSRTKEVRKIKERCPDLIFVDFEDYKKETGKINARRLFS